MNSDYNEEVEMIGECITFYQAKKHEDGRLTITIEIPNRFSNLWLIKLSELRTSAAEITEYEPTP